MSTTRKRARSTGIGNVPTNLVLMRMGQHLNRADVARLGLAVPQHRQLHTNVAQVRKQEIQELRKIVSAATVCIRKLFMPPSRKSVAQRKAFIDSWIRHPPVRGFTLREAPWERSVPFELVGKRHYVRFMVDGSGLDKFSVRRLSDHQRVFWASFSVNGYGKSVDVLYGAFPEQLGAVKSKKVRSVGNIVSSGRETESVKVLAALTGILDALPTALPGHRLASLEDVGRHGEPNSDNDSYSTNSNSSNNNNNW